MADLNIDTLVSAMTPEQRRAATERLAQIERETYHPTEYSVGYNDGTATYLNRTAVRLCAYGVIFADHANTSQYGKKYVLIPWHKVDYVTVDTGSAYLSELFD